MTAPTFSTEVEGASWDTTTSPKTTGGITASTGDVVVVFAGNEDAVDALNTPTNTGTAQTWSLLQSNTTSSTCGAKAWGATLSAGFSANTISVTSGGTRKFNDAAYVFTSASGVGASAKNTAPTTAGTVSITTQQDNSAVVVMCFDFGAVDGTTRTWATVNGTTPTAANGFEKTYFRNSLNYTVYGAYYPDVGTAGAKTVGISSPSTSTAFTVIAVEVKGVAGGGTPPILLPARPGQTWLDRFHKRQQLPAATAGTTSSVNLSDTGAGADALTVSATTTLADTGAGSDALTVSATVPLADVGTGTDALTVTASLPLSDTGTGTDALSVTATVALADTGTGADGITVTATVPLTDSGTGVDAITVDTGTPNKSLSDTGSGADAITATATIPLSDIGTGADSLTVSVSPTLADTGLAVDALTVIVTPALADAGTATDGLGVTATIPLIDAATAADVLSVIRGGVVTPISRTVFVGVDIRTRYVAETRTLYVLAQPRTVTVATDPRIVYPQPENRTSY